MAMDRKLRLILVISILASFVAFLDGSVVNVALPSITRHLGGGLAVQQWIVDAYLLTLGSLILLAGSLSDIFGRKKILAIGLLIFGLASILCALAPTHTFLIIARALQGAGGALLVPSSLAIIISNFEGAAKSKAIGTWTAWTGIAFIIGPLLGGFLVDDFTWRLIFAINVIPIILCLWLLTKVELSEKRTRTRLDGIGALLCSLGLLGTVFALIEQPDYGWHSLKILLPFILGVLLLIAFITYESKIKNAMLPISLFKIRNFTVGNIATVAIYGGLSVATFLIVIFLQEVGGYSAFDAGLSLLPVTIIMFLLSPQFGKLAGIYGPRLFMSLGPLIAGIGFILISRVTLPIDYTSKLLPGILVFSLGLSMTVAPLTAAVLGKIEQSHSGIASAVNNAISRIAGLIAIAVIGVIVGRSISLSGFHDAITLTAGLLIIGGAVSAVGIEN
ncbi:MAG TPA: MFS transporter [Candidatus Sulfotelmatobacter sp.]|nr:MFS transporter [Candidatus Sulfotelmatobacter sp.]